ncbi:MAG: hypothetical protein ACN6PK_13850 [Pseudomonas shirazensis]
MIGQAIPDQRQIARDWLSSCVDGFIVHGGTIEVLPGAGNVPLPARREPGQLGDAARKPVNKKTAARLKRIAEIRELAKTMTYAQAMAHTGICQGVLVRYAADGGFKFQPDPRRGKGNLGRKLSDPVEDRRKAEKIVAYREAGLKRKDAIKLLGISYKQLARILREFNLKFPTTAERQAKRKQ